MGIWKAIGHGVKRLPWRKIAKYGGAAVGVPVIASQTGANAEIVEVANSSAITEHILIVVQAVLGLLTAIVEDKRRKVKDNAA